MFRWSGLRFTEIVFQLTCITISMPQLDMIMDGIDISNLLPLLMDTLVIQNAWKNHYENWAEHNGKYHSFPLLICPFWHISFRIPWSTFSWFQRASLRKSRVTSWAVAPHNIRVEYCRDVSIFSINKLAVANVNIASFVELSVAVVWWVDWPSVKRQTKNLSVWPFLPRFFNNLLDIYLTVFKLPLGIGGISRARSDRMVM